jgi:alpha,alpha-trehalase
MAHYSVTNTAPRPESYLTDYLTATSGVNYTLSQLSALYAELASGAETGIKFESDLFNDDLILCLRLGL